MKITKIGHCCLLLEDGGRKIMTDPGSYTIDAQEKITDISVILITHEHQDHFHIDSVKKLLETNPGVTIVTNAAVGKILESENIAYTKVGDGEKSEVATCIIEGFGKDHAPIYSDMGKVENTGYLVNNRFYFPGDNFHNPGKKVDILALPVAAPWLKISETIDFAKEIKARIAFGVHDGMIIPSSRPFVGMLLKNFLP
ncbi:MAG TPA: MBL fold metallo-hydrolase, partial [Candidatus Paceibacterota bacterium]|nr:MBL fold metallo-hydrolase [Candidatus Paceibacterota bacterium]